MIAKSLVLLAVALNLASAGKLQPVDDLTRDKDFIDYYDCTGKANGNYYHPWDCTKFITCSNGYASERDCAACNPGDPRCPEGRTNFDEPSDACLWPDVARCVGGPGPGPTTAAPTTAAPPTTANPEACTPDCNERGYCDEFQRCDKDGNGGGIWVNVTCGAELWWDSITEPSASLHGGICTTWDKLHGDLKIEYLTDPTCIPPPSPTTTTSTTPAPIKECDWFEIGACSDGYIYNHPIRTGGENRTLNCEGGLLWNHNDKTCDNCWAVKDRAGAPCCDAPAQEEDDTKEIYSCQGLKDGIYKNERDCRTFWKCLNGNPAKISCPAAEVFNPELLVCEPEELSSRFCN